MIKLKEGCSYHFHVEREIKDPADERHLVLIGPDQHKYLLPVAVYSHYKLRPGMDVKCRIDRINCDGKVFLEPENPFYKVGRSYLFEVTGRSTRTDLSGKEQKVFIVFDRFGNHINIPCSNDHPLTGERIRLRVLSISKGMICLEYTKISEAEIHLRAGRFYEFHVEALVKGIDDEKYLIIKDHSGSAHALPFKYYGYYGLEPGVRFTGKVVRNSKSGTKRIEPVNPYYRTGSAIKLSILSCSMSAVNKSFTLELLDKYGFLHYIESPVIPQGDTVKCRIARIKKGRPVIEIM